MSEKFDPTNGSEATAQQMALVNPTVENLIAVGILKPNRQVIDAWLKDDPDGGKGRAVQRIRAEVRNIVENKCHEDLGLLYDQVNFENFPAMGITVHATLIPEDLRNLLKYADEYLIIYYKYLAKLIDTWFRRRRNK